MLGEHNVCAHQSRGQPWRLVNLDFVNRDAELRALDAAARSGGLFVVFGRRRVGKTRLLRQRIE
jgi:hypothetical protein